MNAMEALRCYECSSLPGDFVVLTCNHVLCGQCMTPHNDHSTNLVSVPCRCGIVTNFPTFTAARDSNFRLGTNKKRSSLEVRNNKDCVLDQSSYAIMGTTSLSLEEHFGTNSKASRSTLKQQLRRHSSSKNLGNYLLNELANEIKFMQLRFKRYLNEINRHYSKLLVELNRQYNQLSAQIVDTFTAKIQNNQIRNLSHIESHISRTFKAGLEKVVTKLSSTLQLSLKALAVHSSTTHGTSQGKETNTYQSRETGTCQGKENRPVSLNKGLEQEKSQSRHANCVRDHFEAYSNMVGRNKQKTGRLRKKGKQANTSVSRVLF